MLLLLTVQHFYTVVHRTLYTPSSEKVSTFKQTMKCMDLFLAIYRFDAKFLKCPKVKNHFNWSSEAFPKYYFDNGNVRIPTDISHTFCSISFEKGCFNHPFLKYRAVLFNLALCHLKNLEGYKIFSGSWFAEHNLVLSKHSPSKTLSNGIFLVWLPDGRNHTTDCWAVLRQFCLSSSTTAKETCWLFSTFCSHSQMSIRENLEMEGLYVCHEQGQFTVAAVSWWHRLILTQPTFLLQNHKVKAPGALLPFSIRYEFFSSLY